ncbi:electron transfer flavoprotein subunit alpha/FixB family protein [Paracholeplasma manati]|uniref:Electron transfer flavoprotein subunit alpha/FixB family protein n=1 Tax=Paracholeplasma manati TaxID=591373 RepID=A0ABT2Y7N1_9MOLU|nr:electron transfer flavoprotein subunit alpha/FixB family protein [Paracholeplasma manati]MCV2232749.1 electron transfer flavoprotein subunit alpha/FixB family protein [Paracholeplasma manati]MDG0887943.1 electron transfer flavoprotein subunit alpha/FixB family protein [Paracholeplasma manati]
MNNVWVFMEQNHGKLQPIGLELLSECRRKLTQDTQISAVYFGEHLTDKDKDAMTFCGADEIICTLDSKLSQYDTHYYAKAIENLMKHERPDVFLIGSTLQGRDLAPRVSARLNTGLTADATLLEFEQGEKLLLLATRPALGGNLFATIICENNIPQMATIRPSIFKIEEDKSRASTLKEVPFVCESTSKVKVLHSEKLTHKKVELNKAQVIVAGGRGVSNMFPVLKDIANLIGGEVAASRAVVDANIEQKDRLVGQTGTTVHPKVYFASGISGAIQHISGMDKSELIIAVNTDPNALIFDVADISIIADAKQVLPLVKEELKAILAYK